MSPVRTTKRRPVTVASLLDAAEAVFAERGVEGASIGELCAAAGLTRGAFYSNFSDKHELFFALYERRREHLARTVEAQRDDVLAAADPVAEFARRIVGFGGDAYRPWFLITLEFTLLGARHQHAAARLAQARATTVELIAQIVTDVLHAAAREPRGEAVEIADAVVAAFLGWQTQRLAKTPDEVPGCDRHAEDLIAGRMTAMSRPVEPLDRSH